MWTAFAASVGGSAAGLTGLTFIVVSFRFDVIGVSSEYRNRAAQVLSIFLTITLASALINVPQSLEALGVELLLLSIGSAALLLALDAAARREDAVRARWTVIVALALFAAGLAAAGLLCIVGREQGLGFYAASALLGLAWGAYGAWVFLTQAGVQDAEQP